MVRSYTPIERDDRVVVVGAGMAGLAAAARLAHAGVPVTVLERHSAPGGKLRCLPSAAGPVAAGPTVLTLRPVFDALFASLGERLDDHVRLIRQRVIARHFWPDGSKLDLLDDEEANVDAIRAFAGARAAREFMAFSQRARKLFAGFESPVMQASRPGLLPLARSIIRRPRLLRQMAPLSTLASLLGRSFSDPRLAQLFGRYATYVGGLPDRSPALLALIWQAEVSGVWAPEGGLHELASSLAEIARRRGATFCYGAHVDRIDIARGAVSGVVLECGERIAARTVLFNGDPRALARGGLGDGCRDVAAQTLKTGRSLSADVWAFAARASGPELAYHNVFFCADPAAEFELLARGRRCPSPTLYICALDRALGPPPRMMERFEIIANAPPMDGTPPRDEVEECRNRTFRTLDRFDLFFDPAPETQALTTPATFDSLFPHSQGSLYGQSPHGLLAAFKRPTARTPIRGLYLAGGGTHPGAGLPMATLSARHATEAILTDRTSRWRSGRTATPGGTSTGSATTAGAPSASSPS